MAQRSRSSRISSARFFSVSRIALNTIIAESKRAARETQTLINLTCRLSEADARLARALSEVGTDLNEASPRVRCARTVA